MTAITDDVCNVEGISNSEFGEVETIQDLLDVQPVLPNDEEKYVTNPFIKAQISNSGLMMKKEGLIEQSFETTAKA